MARVTIKKVPNGYKVTLFRRTLSSKKIVSDDLGTFSTKAKANKEARVARRLAN